MLNYLRQVDVFDPSEFKNRVDVIGVGAVGSKIVTHLAKHGITNIHVWDFDDIQSHNLPNQNYSPNDIGKPKVDALAENIFRDTEIEIRANNHRVDGSEELGEFVFMCVDKMQERWDIWNTGIKHKPNINLMIETRIGRDFGRVYAIEPNNIIHCDGWEERWYPDRERNTSQCQVETTLGLTAEFCATVSVLQLIRWTDLDTYGNVDDDIANETFFGLRPPAFQQFTF